MKMLRKLLVGACFLGITLCPAVENLAKAGKTNGTVKLRTKDKWQIEVSGVVAGKAVASVLTVNLPDVVKVVNQKYGKFPDYNATRWGGWNRGVSLVGLRAQECTGGNALIPASLRIASSTDATAEVYVKGKDFEGDMYWGSFGRLPRGRIKPGQTVYISYDYALQRVDSVVMNAKGMIYLKKGVARIALPTFPALTPGEKRLANIYIPGNIDKLTEEQLFPIMETAYPGKTVPVTDKLLPKTMQKLRNGKKIRILAWGDSVTDGNYLPGGAKDRWQNQFVRRLQQRFPKARIELITEAWGGHNTVQYLAEPSGAVHNYQEKVLAWKPDLIIMEFVNDTWTKEVVLNKNYNKFLNDFKNIGAELIIHSPHYIRPEWMGLKSLRNIDDDPRIYTKVLREFTSANQIPLTDVSSRYGRLWRQGIPFQAIMHNTVNHPNRDGMAIYTDSLMALFPEK